MGDKGITAERLGNGQKQQKSNTPTRAGIWFAMRFAGKYAARFARTTREGIVLPGKWFPEFPT